MKRIFILLLFIIPCGTQAQLSTWVYKDSLFTFNLSVERFNQSDEGSDTTLYDEIVRDIRVLNKEVREIQYINIDSSLHSDTYKDRKSLFIIEDVNFDGHNDIRLMTLQSYRNSNYKQYTFWFYNPDTGFYNRDTSALSELLSPEFNPRKKMICYYYQNQGLSSYYAKHVWDNGNLKLIEEIDYEREANLKRGGYIRHSWIENGIEKQTITRSRDGHICPCNCE